ncbi:MAG TPA: protein phosphatase 2C domain-containing protein [Ktedonobacterales bacterium]|nr:protein phosphatase 2C domain-containing protein [Ktedonobacterales bacterium]
MNCVQCGAELRPGARFCNRCGTTQPDSPTAGATAQPAVAVEQLSAELEGDTSQVKRPPRPLRHGADEADVGDEAHEANEADGDGMEAASAPPAPPVPSVPNAASAPEDLTTSPIPAMPPLADIVAAVRTSGQHDEAQAEGAVRGAPIAPPAPPAGADSEDVVSAAVESAVELPAPDAGPPAMRQAPGTVEVAPLAETPPAPGDTPPSWPLTPGTLAGGRYRIERVTATEQEAPGAENTYLVTDRRGYERCWSCGAEPGSADASEAFCERCGADLLAREYMMTERRLGAPDDEKTVPLMGTEPGAVTFFEAGRVYRVAPQPAELPAFPAGAYLVAGAACDIGISRHSGRNEDSLGVTTLSLDSDSRRHTLGIYIVADGLGGHANGQEASQTVVRVFTQSLLRALALPLADGELDPTPDALHEALLAAANAANVALLAANKNTGADSGSTLAAALVWDETAYVANVGDSRGYVYSDDTLRRLTIDHSLVENLVAGGIIAPEDRYTHPQRNQILRSLGDERRVAVDVFEQRLRPGMRLLLCSDGLWEMVRDDELARILADSPHPQEAADTLVRAANTHGGEDNISAIVIEVRA